ncbi:MAG: hypothetical protein A2W74_04450 [Planctomycetes bacterium RIFCSPLOWO2_12_38_17]|nr:MAG: hypothetical protein A2W74_04450 [Planctomycetes bacterium RIFCSPLOWO2_12_38_17]
MATNHLPGRRKPVATMLKLEEFRGLKEELSEWRIQGQQDTGILGFVRGLRLSARLIYAIRHHLSFSGYEVDWGHLLTQEGDYCSPECDIIIHKQGYVRQWNGNHDPVMNFKFISCQDAVAVISCKSSIASVDKTYTKAMGPYVNKVFLFAECCEPRAVKRLKKSALTAGYEGFWYLYACDKTMQCTVDENEWINFLDVLKKLVDAHSRRTP